MTTQLGAAIPCPRKYHEIVPLLISARQECDPGYNVVDAEKDYIADPVARMNEAWEELKRQGMQEAWNNETHAD